MKFAITSRGSVQANRHPTPSVTKASSSPLDNTAVESFHLVLKVEYIHRHVFATRAEARLKVAMWIADF
ncbi:integrase core domain-containing protein [Streptomyces caniscabiei]|uniref:integrase core domain-containing protein n=1 Tax=Streptomyces caniscabiei TaxID=2746961 RepID=UPI00117EB6DB|nr:integrase core domain-containing protein [Streptomyces caniscabiei]